eukprot:CAMPEP_0119005716 /NCGR_PEP_ID=MMETSP1176-20130426/1886_1 /TAXON_ID=265551 /ORGANISM="Synedropsis recta cf, Strain CCMP1620" /LENGTH=413 /DNA_ID=CAMNT_0006957557 /DNA_START=53 /DNA_END=1294 /DNA_ORIENTATION=-
MPPTVTVYLLTGDVGGTNSRMSLYDTASSIPLAVKYYRNQEALTDKSDGAFESKIISPFLQFCWETVKHLVPIEEAEIISCLACAGPVRDNKVHMSNLGINIDGTAIEKNIFSEEIYIRKINRALIINDFVAQGYGCLTLDDTEVKELTPGSHKMIDCNGPKVCVGAGTGLGECYLTPNGNGSYGCFPSEGGHVEYNPRSDLEIKLRSYLMNKFGNKHRISTERVVSGMGLANVYEFLAAEFPDQVDKAVHDEFLSAGDMQGKVVSVNAKDGSLCKQALEIMISAYGSEVGSAAVKWIPTGGLFVTGGLTPKNIQHIEGQDSGFMKAFLDKGRVSPVLSTIPLFAVMVEDLGVRGAHKACLMEYERMTKSEPKAAPTTAISSSHPSSFLAVAALATTAALAMATGFLLAKKRA